MTKPPFIRYPCPLSYAIPLTSLTTPLPSLTTTIECCIYLSSMQRISPPDLLCTCCFWCPSVCFFLFCPARRGPSRVSFFPFWTDGFGRGGLELIFSQKGPEHPHGADYHYYASLSTPNLRVLGYWNISQGHVVDAESTTRHPNRVLMNFCNKKL